MHCGIKENLCCLAQTLFIGGSQIWRSLKIVQSHCGVRKKMYQIKKTLPPIRDFMNERSQKLTKTVNLNLLKFDCQNLPFRSSLASSQLNLFKGYIFPIKG